MLIIPIMLIMNYIGGMTGLVWSQAVADFVNILIAGFILCRVDTGIRK